MSSSVTDIDSRLAALQAVAHDWRLKKSTQSSQTNYISILRLLTEEVSLLTRTRDIQTLVSSSVFSRMLAIAVEHAQTGMMSWLVVVGWDNVIQTVLGYVEDKKLFCVYTDQLWKAMLKIVKEGSYAANTPSTHALTSCLYLLRTLFEYAPVEVKVLRRQLPHPVKCVSILAREHSFRLLPFLVHNMAKCTLNADLLEYIKRGFESPEPSVVAAVVRAVEEILFSGTIIETAHRTVLLELLIHYVDRDVSLPDDTLHDAGLVLGCLFEFFQCEVNRYTPEAKAKWNYPAGVNPQQARKVLAPLFMPTIRPNIIKVFSVAFSQLLLRCAVPELMEDAIRSLFVLMLSIPENNRLLMSRIVVNAITEWVGRMPSNAHRIAFLIHIRGYLRGNHKEILPAKTALLCMCKAAPMLFSGREIDFVDDFLQLVEHQPFLMLPVCETIASFTTHSPIFLRRILKGLLEQCLYYVDNALTAIPLELIVCARTVECFEDEILALPAVRQALLKGTFSFDISEKQTLDEDGGTTAKYTEMELFFFFSRILFEYHSEDLSDFVIDKINTSVSTLISQLVSTPVHTNAYRRAAASACEFLHVRGGINNVERTLCMGLLEGQLVNREETSTPERGYDTTVLAKLKGQVYRMVVDSSWVPGDSGVDDGTIRWLVSQALHDVEQLCDDEIPITIENTELFPACTARVLVSLRQTTCKPQHKERARDGLVAVDLISWGLYYFRNESFSSAILQRVESLRKAWGNGVASKWNTFLLLFRFLSRLLEYAADDEDDGVSLVAIFSNAIALWLKSAQTELGDPQLPLDMEILIAKVGGRALALIHQVDQYTSQVTFAAAQNKNTERDNVVSVLLMSEAHTCSRGQSSTLPLATSFMADLLRRSGFCGKPCPPITLALFIGYLHLLESITFDLESILQALSAVLISPIAAPIDRLTLSLLQVFVGQVKNVMLGRTTNGDFWNDFEVILIRHTLSPRTHITTTNANEVQAELIYDCLETLKRSASPEQLVRLQLTCAHPLRKSTLHQAVHFSVSQAFGKLWLSCVMGVEARYHDVLRIPLQCIARQMDSATTYPCREAWNAVAAHLVTASLDTMLGSIDEIYTILQAKAPAVLTKAPRKEGETSNRRDGQAEAADGEDWEGQESILSGGKGKGEPTVTSDIASKVMMLDLLDGALCLTHQSSATDAKEKEKSRKILEAIVSAIPQVETMPELVGPAIQLMREVLEKFGWTMVDSNNPKQPKVPFLLPHKSQIVASLKSLLQLSLLHIGEACRLFEVFLYCNLADDTTVRRVLRGFFLFILVIEKLEEDDEAATISGESGPVILSLTRAIHRAQTENWSETYSATLEFLESDSSQETLALICNQHITTKALLNGCLPPFDHSALSDANFYNDYGTVEEVLEAVSQICRGGQLCLTLRYSAGCLACLAITDPEEVVEAIPHFMSELNNTHQKVLVNLAHRELKNGNGNRESLLVDIILASSIPLNEPIIKNVANTVFKTTPAPSVQHVGGLLNGALETSSDIHIVCDCLGLLPVDFMRVAPATVELMAAYLQSVDEQGILLLSTCSVSGFVLIERITHRFWQSETIEMVYLLLLKEALLTTSDPVAIAEFMCNTKKQVFGFYKILFSFIVSFDVSEQDLVIKCERLLCKSILASFELHDGESPSQESVNEGLELLVFAIDQAPLKDLLRILLHSVGAVLTNALIPKYPEFLKTGIQSIGNEKALKLRRFMERTSTGA